LSWDLATVLCLVVCDGDDVEVLAVFAGLPAVDLLLVSVERAVVVLAFEVDLTALRFVVLLFTFLLVVFDFRTADVFFACLLLVSSLASTKASLLFKLAGTIIFSVR